MTGTPPEANTEYSRAQEASRALLGIGAAVPVAVKGGRARFAIRLPGPKGKALVIVSALTQEPIGCLELIPLRKGLRQSSPGTAGQLSSNSHEPFCTALVSQFRRREFHLRPLGGRHQGRIHM